MVSIVVKDCLLWQFGHAWDVVVVVVIDSVVKLYNTLITVL